MWKGRPTLILNVPGLSFPPLTKYLIPPVMLGLPLSVQVRKNGCLLGTSSKCLTFWAASVAQCGALGYWLVGVVSVTAICSLHCGQNMFLGLYCSRPPRTNRQCIYGATVRLFICRCLWRKCDGLNNA